MIRGSAPANGHQSGRQAVKDPPAHHPEKPVKVALVGNPNSGKTTLFNALTGLNQKVSNYPGITVERKAGLCHIGGREFTLIDLPGTYSLCATSEDERLVRDLLLGLVPGEDPIDMVVVVTDATHLQRHLYLATQVMDLGIPLLVALTMNDEAKAHGHPVDPALLSAGLKVPVVEVIVPRKQGIDALREQISETVGKPSPIPDWKLGEKMLGRLDELAEGIARHRPAPLNTRRHLALQLLADEKLEHPLAEMPELAEKTVQTRVALESEVPGWRESEARGRYQWINKAIAGTKPSISKYKLSRSDKVDAILTHPVWGLVFFTLVMAIVFQSVFTWAGPFMDAIEAAFNWIGAQAGSVIPPGPLNGLLVDGVIGGIGGVVVFLPQILILFFFIVFLEDTGYMSRAAFLMNRHMRRAGLHGKAFVPLMSGFACSVPALMSARTIGDKRDRLVTMLVIPLVSCSARLPVYALVIAAFIPAVPVIGNFKGFTWQGLVLLSAYLFSLAAAITAAYLLRSTLFKGEAMPFVLELPPYRAPYWRTILLALWERGKLFLVQAGTIILAANIVLWFALNFPVHQPTLDKFNSQRQAVMSSQSGLNLDAALAEISKRESAELMQYSFAGQAGRMMEPVLKPLGFDWKIGIGLVGSLAAREVFVSTLAVVYGIGEADESSGSLIEKLRGEFGMFEGLSIILFFILACQCLATVAVMKRESNSWKWALFLFVYMTLLAYFASLVFYQSAIRIWPNLS